MSPPARPEAVEEHLARWLLHALAPRLPGAAPAEPPRALAPFERRAISRPGRHGTLAATWYPAEGEARAAVLLLHPWVRGGQAYFHRDGRISELREAGYHAVTVDMSGFGGSDRAWGLPDRDLPPILAALAAWAPGLPLHLWGVSFGGYWAHLVLSARAGVAGALFEDVSPHLLEYSALTAPRWRFAYAVFRRLVPRAHRFLDLRRHAPRLKVATVGYVGGDADGSVPEAETRGLARLAGGECLIVPGAPHLGASRLARDTVLAFALGIFERAERR
jgi:pimeloyl-ACP methyl ester carboxylesterase